MTGIGERRVPKGITHPPLLAAVLGQRVLRRHSSARPPQYNMWSQLAVEAWNEHQHHHGRTPGQEKTSQPTRHSNTHLSEAVSTKVPQPGRLEYMVLQHVVLACPIKTRSEPRKTATVASKSVHKKATTVPLMFGLKEYTCTWHKTVRSSRDR